MGKRQYEAAQALLEPLVEKRPDDAQLQYALGSVLYIQGHLAEAEARLRESLRLEPDQLASPYYLALVARDQGRDAEAIERLEELLQALSGSRAVVRGSGRTADERQRYEEAETQPAQGRRAQSRSRSRPTTSSACSWRASGRKEEADKQLAQAKSLREEDEATSRLQLRLLDPDQ